jgi:hypothetical protein
MDKNEAREVVRPLIIACDRMLDRWSEVSVEERNRLWGDLHAESAQVAETLGIYPHPPEIELTDAQRERFEAAATRALAERRRRLADRTDEVEQQPDLEAEGDPVTPLDSVILVVAEMNQGEYRADMLGIRSWPPPQTLEVHTFDPGLPGHPVRVVEPGKGNRPLLKFTLKGFEESAAGDGRRRAMYTISAEELLR